MQLCGAMRGYAVLCGAMRCYAVLCGAMRGYAGLCGAMRCYAGLCGAMRCYAGLCGAMRCYAVLCGAMRGYAVLCGPVKIHPPTACNETQVSLHNIRSYTNVSMIENMYTSDNIDVSKGVLSVNTRKGKSICEFAQHGLIRTRVSML